VSLGGGVLIKENHIAAQNLTKNQLASAVQKAREEAPHSLRIEVEVKNHEEAMIAAKAGAEIIMLDNFEPKEIARTAASIKKMNQAIWVEVSGGVRLETLKGSIHPGVDVLSVGALTHHVKSLDQSLLVEGWKASR
jgi:nicotinate-nucleotide pyrophosphorylase (carboxylating)